MRNEFAREFLEIIIKPVLNRLEMGGTAAERLMLGTALAETGLREVEQGLGRRAGPALGYFQMEPATYSDLWVGYINCGRIGTAGRHVLLGYISRDAKVFSQTSSPPPDADFHTLPDVMELVYCPRFACAMSRILYRRIPHPLPRPDDIEALAAYWKKWYNTEKGKGTIEHYLAAWEDNVGG